MLDKADRFGNLSSERFARRKPQIGPIRCSDNATQPIAKQQRPKLNRSGHVSLRAFQPSPSLLRRRLLLLPLPALAQSGDAKSSDKPPAAQPADAAKEAQRQVDEFAEASRLVTGPAGNPECVWLGRRVVGLLWRDDMDTAFRHLDLYDRFGCPGPHIQAAFRCVVRQGNNIDPKSPQSLNARVHSCWVNPTAAQTAGGRRTAASSGRPGGVGPPPAATSRGACAPTAARNREQGSALGAGALRRRTSSIRHRR